MTNIVNNPFNLKNKIVIVTGSVGDIGISIVDALLKSNAIVYGFDRNPNNNILSKKYTHFECDLTNINSFKSSCNNIYSIEGQIDVLINNAGITIPANDDGSYSYENWEKTICINLTTPFFCSQVVMEFMKKNNIGSIINITSISAELGFPNNPAYGASKGGLKALSKSLASEWA